jgi:hypothetical protein
MTNEYGLLQQLEAQVRDWMGRLPEPPTEVTRTLARLEALRTSARRAAQAALPQTLTGAGPYPRQSEPEEPVSEPEQPTHQANVVEALEKSLDRDAAKDAEAQAVQEVVTDEDDAVGREDAP